MEFHDTDLENFLREDMRAPQTTQKVIDAIRNGPGGRDSFSFNLWHLDIDREKGTVHLEHDFDDRETTYPIADFLAALDAHAATLEPT